MDETDIKLAKMCSQIGDAVNLVKVGEFGKAKDTLENCKQTSECSICKHELTIAIDNVSHTGEACNVDVKECDMNKRRLINDLSSLKRDIEAAIES